MLWSMFGLVAAALFLSLSRLLPAQASEPSPRVLEDQDSLDDAFHDFHWFLMMTLWFNCSPVVFPTNLKVSVPIPPLSFHALFVTPRTKFQRILFQMKPAFTIIVGFNILAFSCVSIKSQERVSNFYFFHAVKIVLPLSKQLHRI